MYERAQIANTYFIRSSFHFREAIRAGVLNPQKQKGWDLTQSYDKSP